MKEDILKAAATLAVATGITGTWNEQNEKRGAVGGAFPCYSTNWFWREFGFILGH